MKNKMFTIFMAIVLLLVVGNSYSFDYKGNHVYPPIEDEYDINKIPFCILVETNKIIKFGYSSNYSDLLILGKFFNCDIIFSPGAIDIFYFGHSMFENCSFSLSASEVMSISENGYFENCIFNKVPNSIGKSEYLMIIEKYKGKE